VCDEALARIADVLRPSLVIGVGGFAEKRARAALGPDAEIGCILHPSPASPAANRDWAGLVDAQLEELGFAPQL
jgi:single-strand selective monofunctional uracil DNA glycosylase